MWTPIESDRLTDCLINWLTDWFTGHHCGVSYLRWVESVVVSDELVIWWVICMYLQCSTLEWAWFWFGMSTRKAINATLFSNLIAMAMKHLLAFNIVGNDISMHRYLWFSITALTSLRLFGYLLFDFELRTRLIASCRIDGGRFFSSQSCCHIVLSLSHPIDKRTNG